MPVTLVYIDHARWSADEHLRFDLQRIFEDAPVARLPANGVADFIEHHLARRQFFACAHFNEHLLAAVVINEAEDRAWWLSELCVRANTRRRGVGSRLMALLAERAKQEGRALRIAVDTLPLADQLLLSKLGYRPFSGDTPGADGAGGYVELDPR
ncbi:acetyl-CoA sensor PanZ family protein [Vreelandella malpeensis]|uniref:Acetyl-CoA sensor PanZ family protein n=1 Tax=Vreelandella malpeensis TaxID=1172368 RepID=A0ABS8DRX7_9GAMM|nr:GNAT family N-acetyltransferase [Halomonas malpeensis]MCB8889082.1 acetyl-CoA sensor PanZ family protein [Halomonas malpeensis]